MKFLKYFRAGVIIITTLLILAGLILTRYYVIDRPAEDQLADKVDSFSMEENQMTTFIDSLEVLVAPIQIHPEEFQKEDLF